MYIELCRGRYNVAQGDYCTFSLFHVPTERRIWSHSDRLRGQLVLPAGFNASYSVNDADKLVITAFAVMLAVDGGDDDISGSGTNAANQGWVGNSLTLQHCTAALN